MSQAVIITENKYPLEDAGAIRQHAMAKILKDLGYEVTVVGYGKYTGKTQKEYDGIKYISLKPKSQNKIIRFIYRIIFGFRVIKYIKKHIPNPSVILLVDTLPYSWKIIEKYGIKHNATLIHDSVEWYSPEEYANGEKNIEYRLKEKTNTEIINKNWNVIAISSFLQNHFEKLAKKVERIPVIMDTDSIKYRIESDGNSEKIRFVYVGAPGRKDYIKEIAEGFCLLGEEYKAECELHIIGVTKEQLKTKCQVDNNTLDLLGETLFVHGRLPHNEAVEWVSKADYTLLLRDADLRYAKAGFPTKIVESLSCGTPPVCNLSSDLSMYLRDGENAVISNGHSPKDLKEALIKSINYSFEQKRQMRISARKTAEENFHYKRYIEEFKNLL